MRRNTVSYGLPLVLETTSERNLEPNETEETSETAMANIVGYERVSSIVHRFANGRRAKPWLEGPYPVRPWLPGRHEVNAAMRLSQAA
jgi:hypothetical protein